MCQTINNAITITNNNKCKHKQLIITKHTINLSPCCCVNVHDPTVTDYITIIIQSSNH